MRNWNCVSLYSCGFSGSVFTVPMRNWNLLNYTDLKIIQQSFLQYLWGIETVMVFLRRLLQRHVFTVPMGNWNYHIFLNPAILSPSFYSTYEELKLKRGTLNSRKKFCFYSTYEELKHFPLSIPKIPQLRFLQYLWGIETSLQGVIALYCNSVFTVPMRNWNRLCFLELMRYRARFYSTYEELKLVVLY